MKVKPQRWLTKNLKTCFKDHFIVCSDYVRLWKARLGLNLNKLKCFEDKIPQKFPSSLRSLKKRLLYSMFFLKLHLVASYAVNGVLIILERGEKVGKYFFSVSFL